MNRDPRICSIELGEVVIDLVCRDAGFAASMREYFGQAPVTRPATVTLDLHLVNHAENPPVPNSLLLDKAVDGQAFDLAGGLVRGTFDPATGHGELRVMTILTNGPMTRVFEQILYQVFQTAVRRLDHDACLVHSAGVVCGDRGFLFVGPSEAGKSTVASLSADHAVVNDEMNLVAFTGSGPRLLASPFNGFHRDKQAATAPLAAVILLAKGAEHRLDTIGSGQAAAAIAAQIAPPVGLLDLPAPATTEAMLETALRLVEAVPARRLTFRKDAGFWPVILSEFPPSDVRTR
jgi:hypothetical protein